MRVGGWGRAVRVLGVVVLLSVAWLQLALPPLPHDPHSALGGSARETPEFDPSLSYHRSPASKFLQTKAQHQTSVKTILSQEQILEIREQIQLRSGNETVLNEELYGPIQADTIVIAVQVCALGHWLLYFMEAIIGDWHGIGGRNRNLSYYLFTLKVMQIFYPHSLQTHPHSFPGESQGDCPRDTKPEEAAKLKCVGTPDLYKHYREARFTQTKHHWWWKANKIFDDIWILRNHTGLVLFLEEDHYVAEDFLHMLRLLTAAIPRACPKCSLITLGNYLKNYNFQTDGRKCLSDDDFDTNYCPFLCLSGVHHKKKDCSSRTVLNKVHRALQNGQRTLFPRQLIVVHTPPKKVKKHKGNGGWGDKRDHALCHSFSVSTSPEHSMVNNSFIPFIPIINNSSFNGSVARSVS
ncbi:alpha-1,6-mannosyl-glycoprotein 2-beta-N-acetylglucosaminyltransferase-like [Macrobrachium nipponense]|uniref:alpha-1,6-mannosyl-glycoprotein 2-beta-N-acetylglucosaminyltransferase-like n=1 Tax=Macrobrachium nipponense TaxID=159736 RepID=UPI0030C82A58